MRPSAYSQRGFLGPTESLEAVLRYDHQTLEKLGVTCAQLAEAIENVLQTAQNQREELADRLLKVHPPSNKLKTAGEMARGSLKRQPVSPESLEFKKREAYPNLRHPESLPRFSLENLPELDTGYLVDNKLQVFFIHSRGRQECPWEGTGTYHQWDSVEFLILNRHLGEYFIGPGLIVHLIREHQFFEGLESPYRVEPVKVARVLELVSGPVEQ